jgi:hypothetical protein
VTKYHAIMLDECGEEFGVTFEAANIGHAKDQLREDYPESRMIKLQTVKRQQDEKVRLEQFFADGRPFYHR